MRFFPRGAFKNPPDTPVQVPDAGVQLEQLQQLQQLQQQMWQLQQQMWQQFGMPMAAPQLSIVDPMFLFTLHMLAHQQAYPMPLALRRNPWGFYPQPPNPPCYPMGLEAWLV